MLEEEKISVAPDRHRIWHTRQALFEPATISFQRLKCSMDCLINLVGACPSEFRLQLTRHFFQPRTNILELINRQLRQRPRRIFQIRFSVRNNLRDCLNTTNDLCAAGLVKWGWLKQAHKYRGQRLIQIEPGVPLPTSQVVQLPTHPRDSRAYQKIVHSFGPRFAPNARA